MNNYLVELKNVSVKSGSKYLLKDINSTDIEKTLIDVDEIYTKGNEPRNLAENFIEFLRNVILTLNSNDGLLNLDIGIVLLIVTFKFGVVLMQK